MRSPGSAVARGEFAEALLWISDVDESEAVMEIDGTDTSAGAETLSFASDVQITVSLDASLSIPTCRPRGTDAASFNTNDDSRGLPGSTAPLADAGFSSESTVILTLEFELKSSSSSSHSPSSLFSAPPASSPVSASHRQFDHAVRTLASRSLIRHEEKGGCI